jgi:hypothetical protein
MLPVQAGRGGGGRRPGSGAGGGGGSGGAGGAGRGLNPCDVGGYQHDFDFTGDYAGNLHENGKAANAPAGTNRGIISYKGQIAHYRSPATRRETIGRTGDATDLRT